MDATATLVRSATLADLAGIAQVRVDTWQDAYRGILPQSFLDQLNYRATEDLWRPTLADREIDVFVALRDDHVIGFVSAGPERTADVTYRAEIYALFVRPERQRSGVGRQLFKAAMRSLDARRPGPMMLWTLRDARQARTFYEGLGGRYIRERQIEFQGLLMEEVAYGWPSSSPVSPVRA